MKGELTFTLPEEYDLFQTHLQALTMRHVLKNLKHYLNGEITGDSLCARYLDNLLKDNSIEID